MGCGLRSRGLLAHGRMPSLPLVVLSVALALLSVGALAAEQEEKATPNAHLCPADDGHKVAKGNEFR